MKINELKAVVVCGTEYPGGRERASERVCNEERADSQDRTDAGWLSGSLAPTACTSFNNLRR